MTPKLFGLANDYHSGYTERTFVLIATLLQKLANLQEFEEHEAHLDKMNPILQEGRQKLMKFIDYLCETENPDDSDAIKPEIDIFVDGVAARLCSYFEEHKEVFEKALPDKYIAKFIAELEILTEEMAFLKKKFKTDQLKAAVENPKLSRTKSSRLKRKSMTNETLRGFREKKASQRSMSAPQPKKKKK